MTILFWHWWILAGILLILELLLPTAFFLWLGIAAGLLGLLLMVFPVLPMEIQLILFAVFAVVSTMVWRRFRDRHPVATDQPALNRRGHHYLGRSFTLTEAIEEGIGKITVDDSTWRVRGPDLPAGTVVRVVDLDGVIFVVEPVSQVELSPVDSGGRTSG